MRSSVAVSFQGILSLTFRVLLALILVLSSFNVGPNPSGFGIPVVHAQEPVRLCGPMDVAFVIDDTGSMGPALASVTAGLGTIIPTINAASAGDYRLALVSFKDTITVRDNFAPANGVIVAADIAALVASAGASEPEASDEALETTVSARTKAAADAVVPAGNHQNINFAPDWDVTRSAQPVVKIAILVTDARPGGFDDAFTAGADDAHAHAVALAAAVKGIKISSIYLTHGSPTVTIQTIMNDYAATTGGIYTETADGTGTGGAIADIISSCGTREVDWVTGGGQLVNGDGKDAKKVNFGGNVGSLSNGTLVGQWETNFQNVGLTALNGWKFHSTSVDVFVSGNDGGPGPNPPPANSNVAGFSLTGRLQNKNVKAEGFHLNVCVADRGEPGASDSILLALYTPGGVLIWANAPDFPFDTNAGICPTTTLTNGNLQIHSGIRP